MHPFKIKFEYKIKKLNFENIKIIKLNIFSVRIKT